MTPRLSLIFFLLLPAPYRAADGPQFVAPPPHGFYPGSDVPASGPTDGPPMVWQKPIGQGFSGPVVADHRLILFHRLDNKETVDCLDPRTGKQLWHFDYPTAYRDDFGFDEGPRATPCVADGRVYTYGPEGILHCLEAATGKQPCSVTAKADFAA